MRIKSLRIQNFRSFEDQNISFNRYSCFVGPNGAGKSSVLAALNVSFREQSGAASDVTKLIDEDYFGKITANSIRITLTFDDLNQAAQSIPSRKCFGTEPRYLENQLHRHRESRLPSRRL
jgi:putative ATP-dependent endonuclease of OLD family